MALWFAELRARAVMDQALGRSWSHMDSKYLPRYRQSKQLTVRVGELSEWN